MRFLAPAVLATVFSASVHPAVAQPRTVERFTGTITAANADRFADLLAERLDQVVAIDVSVPATRPADERRLDYVVSRAANGRATVFKGDGDATVGGGVEINIDRSTPRSGGSAARGFYVVRSGGTHQGVLALALVPAERTHPALRRPRIVERPLR